MGVTPKAKRNRNIIRIRFNASTNEWERPCFKCPRIYSASSEEGLRPFFLHDVWEVDKLDMICKACRAAPRVDFIPKPRKIYTRA